MAKTDDKSSWAIGGTLMMGIGVGMFFVRRDPMAFVAFVMIGLGLGLVLVPLLQKLGK